MLLDVRCGCVKDSFFFNRQETKLYCFFFPAGLLLWKCCMWALLSSLPIMQEFNIYKDYVCCYVVTRDNSSMYYVKSWAGICHAKGSIL